MERDIRIVTEAELRRTVRLGLPVVDAVERAFVALAGESVRMPASMTMEIAELRGEVDVKTAYIPGFQSFAVKVSTGFFDNPKINLPSLNGVMILCSAETGLLETLFLDNGYLTDLRTAAAGAVAARHMAPAKVETLGILGTGVQARLQAEAAMLVRPYARVLVWGRDMENAAGCAAGIAGTLNVEGAPEADPARLVGESQMVITATPSHEPLLPAEALHPGLHITAMGSDAPGKVELEPAAVGAADIYACDRVPQCAMLGELRAARQAGVWVDADPPELGRIVTGAVAGRRGPEDITIADLAGTGAQDTAIAAQAAQLIRAAEAGTAFVT